MRSKYSPGFANSQRSASSSDPGCRAWTCLEPRLCVPPTWLVTSDGQRFIGRLLQHVLPPDFTTGCWPWRPRPSGWRGLGKCWRCQHRTRRRARTPRPSCDAWPPSRSRPARTARLGAGAYWSSRPPTERPLQPSPAPYAEGRRILTGIRTPHAMPRCVRRPESARAGNSAVLGRVLLRHGPVRRKTSWAVSQRPACDSQLDAQHVGIAHARR